MDSWVIDIAWDEDNAPDLPRWVGPFATREEADEWFALNVRNGSGDFHKVTYPYMQINGQDVYISLPG